MRDLVYTAMFGAFLLAAAGLVALAVLAGWDEDDEDTGR